MKKISVIIPAHNEEKYIARCICSIKAAAKFYGGDVEIIVVCNRRMPNGTCGGVRGRRIFALLDFFGGCIKEILIKLALNILDDKHKWGSSFLPPFSYQNRIMPW